jgi:hypothetical protein
VICTKKDNRKGPPQEVLLVLHSLVVGDECFELRCFEGIKKPSVLCSLQAQLADAMHLITGKVPRNLLRDPLIKRYLYQCCSW